VIGHHRQRLRGRVRRITIDLDPTDDPTHGQQELAFYNGHYDSGCYLPVVVKLTFGEEAEQHVVAVVLRPGNAAAPVGSMALLRRLFGKLRRAFPRARLRVRMDGGFAAPRVFQFLEEQGVEYVVALAKNLRLAPKGGRLLRRARRRAKQTGRTTHFYGETRYAARSWRRRKRRVIYKAELVCLSGREPRANLRFVVTNLSLSPRQVYEIYRQRGDCENRIKELHHGLELDRTSCSRFLANQLRVQITAAAYCPDARASPEGAGHGLRPRASLDAARAAAQGRGLDRGLREARSRAPAALLRLAAVLGARRGSAGRGCGARPSGIALESNL
jgi:hypothetical protein